MKIPGPDHPITITPAKQRWRALFHGHIIADSAEALVLQEANYPLVVYFPRADVEMDYLVRTDHATHCPYKGDAAYYSLAVDGRTAENAVWTYESPFPAMGDIAGRVAFYPNHVEIYPVDDAAVNTRHKDVDVDAVVQHTDSGSGAAQREPWPPNVEGPETWEGGVR